MKTVNLNEVSEAGTAPADDAPEWRDVAPEWAELSTLGIGDRSYDEDDGWETSEFGAVYGFADCLTWIKRAAAAS